MIQSEPSMKQAVVFCNGNRCNLKYAKKFIKSADYIICADGATKHALKLNLTPHVVIGDFDSFTSTMNKKLAGYQIQWIRYNKEKDQSDTELAMKYAIKKGFKQILLLGLLGDRIDHMIGNLLAFIPLARKGITCIALEGKQEIQICTSRLTITGKISDRVSLIPLEGDAYGVTTSGLHYQLRSENLLFGYSRGISNTMTETAAEISLRKGVLIVTHET